MDIDGSYHDAERWSDRLGRRLGPPGHPAISDPPLALGPAEWPERTGEGGDVGLPLSSRLRVIRDQPATLPNWLRARRERQHRRPANKRDEVAPPHVLPSPK